MFYQELKPSRAMHLKVSFLIKHDPPWSLTITGQERLIRSHSSARFCFELSGNSN